MRGIKVAKKLANVQDLVGKQVGRLFIAQLSREKTGRYKKNGKFYRRYYYICKCECGKEFELRRDSILSGHTKSCGCVTKIKSDDIVGNRFGKLLVKEYIPISGQNSQHEKHYYWCVCDCNPHKKVRAARNSLVTGRKTSCGCAWYPVGSKNPCWKGCGDISGHYWSSLKRGARTRKLAFELNIEEAHAQIQRQQHKCALTGWDISVHGYAGRESMRTASLDRIDNSQGYHKENIQWIHKDLNKLKSVYSNEKVIEVARLISCKLRNSSIEFGSFEGAREVRPTPNAKWKSYKHISGRFWKNVATAAKARGVPLNITAEEAYNQYLEQGKHCALTGAALVLHPPELRNGSLDRIDSTEGYEIDNIQWVLKEVNHMKWEFSQDYFIEICKAVVSHNSVVKKPDVFNS